ncbi:MAG TPA: hypothetical protein VMU03_14505 [Gammaproteobacteria bacterium]|nr:hypothetical protein [Gammaproteobacteria bacterium]
MRVSVVIGSFIVLGFGASSLASAQPPQPANASARPAQAASAQPAAVAPPAGERRATRPPLFLKEDWKQIPGGGEHAVTPASVTGAGVELKLYGASSKEIQLTGADGDENNPTHVWTGLCTTPCGLALRDKARYVDLTGLARIRWNVKTSGFHEVRPIVKLADGTWLAGDHTEASTLDWLVGEFSVASVRWLKLDPERLVTTGNFVDKPDLSKVDEVGFVDLTPASGHGPGGWSDVAQIEVYGNAVKRP